MCLCIIVVMVKEFKLHFYAWIELIVWLILLSIIVGGVRFYQYQKVKDLKTYQIFMPDVDGMIVGSPVKFIGVQVGYIQKIHIVNNTVYVKFVITDKNVTIPQGSIATVEFSGLAGSKSLEIDPPTKESFDSRQLIIINEPKRIHSSLSLLNDMFDKIDAITLKSAHFVNQFNKKTSQTKVNPDIISKEISQIDRKINGIEKNSKDFKKKIKEWNR